MTSYLKGLSSFKPRGNILIFNLWSLALQSCATVNSRQFTLEYIGILANLETFVSLHCLQCMFMVPYSDKAFIEFKVFGLPGLEMFEKGK